MGKHIVWLWVCITFFACRNQKEGEVATDDAPESFSFQNLPQDATLDEAAATLVADWQEFKAIETSYAILKRATNTEDLMLAIDDLIEREKTLAEGSYPEPFDKLQIKSRQQVFRTFLYKVKGNLQDRREVNKSMEEMMLAYNAFKNQFNNIVNNTLDPKLILNGE
ncbi:hypothetical protein FGF1_16000 [Flavobacteriaceae bacterium GF1]